MRIKELKLLVTFPSTVQALHMEQCCRARGMKGRLIPVPREISAGCGMAWADAVTEKQKIQKIISEAGIEIEGIYQLLL